MQVNIRLGLGLDKFDRLWVSNNIQYNVLSQRNLHLILFDKLAKNRSNDSIKCTDVCYVTMSFEVPKVAVAVTCKVSSDLAK